MADNWYIVLELEFDPPVEDEIIISQKIEEKSKFWSTRFNDFKYGAQFRTWHQNIPQIKKDMLGENNIRKQLSAEACTIVYAPIDKLLKTIGRKGSVSEEEGERLAQKLKTSIDIVKKRADKLGIKWVKSEVNYQEVYDKYYKNEYFVRVLDKDVCPETRWVEGSNFVDIGFKIEPRTNRLIMMGALDNLVKGAAGQAVQNMNIMFGLPENEGLQMVPLFP